MDAIVPYYPLSSEEVQIYLTLVHEGMDVMQIFTAHLEAIEIVRRAQIPETHSQPSAS